MNQIHFFVLDAMFAQIVGSKFRIQAEYSLPTPTFSAIEQALLKPKMRLTRADHEEIEQKGVISNLSCKRCHIIEPSKGNGFLDIRRKNKKSKIAMSMLSECVGFNRNRRKQLHDATALLAHYGA